MAIKVKAETEEATTSTLRLSAGCWKFGIGENAHEELLAKLEKMRDAGDDFDKYAQVFLIKGTKFVEGDAPEPWGMDKLLFAETIDAFLAKLYDELSFNPKTKQKKLDE